MKIVTGADDSLIKNSLTQLIMNFETVHLIRNHSMLNGALPVKCSENMLKYMKTSIDTL